MLNFTDLLMGKYDLPPPPVGAGRVHRLATQAESDPLAAGAQRAISQPRKERLARNRAAVLAAIRAGCEIVGDIAAEAGLSRSGTQYHIDALLAENAIRMVGGQRHRDGYHYRGNGQGKRTG